MCGIAGQVGRDPRTIQRRYAAYCAMQQTLARRGPDQRGMYICGAAALIHARLAVVDLENGLQPMQLDWQGETYVLVYNGELYNTPELRTVLNDPAAPLLRIIRADALETLLASGADNPIPWYGQLMTTPQTIAWFLQLDYWLAKYKVELV